MHRPFKGNCERCGQEYVVERGQSFRDEDYLRIWHEYMDLYAMMQAHKPQLAKLWLDRMWDRIT